MEPCHNCGLPYLIKLDEWYAYKYGTLEQYLVELFLCPNCERKQQKAHFPK